MEGYRAVAHDVVYPDAPIRLDSPGLAADVVDGGGSRLLLGISAGGAWHLDDHKGAAAAWSNVGHHYWFWPYWTGLDCAVASGRAAAGSGTAVADGVFRLVRHRNAAGLRAKSWLARQFGGQLADSASPVFPIHNHPRGASNLGAG